MPEVMMTKKILVTPSPSEDDQDQVVERPDGFYWQDLLSKKLHGPFPTRPDAMHEMHARNGDSYEEDDTLDDADAETEIGMANWVDPETGELSEGSLPHLSEE
jgi:hypothetical protein